MGSHRWSAFILRFGVPLLTLFLATAPAAAAGAKAWNEQLQQALAHLRGQRWPEALAGSQKLLDSFMRDLAPGKKADHSVALVVMCRALAQAGLGKEAEAAWDWHVAQQLDPPIEGWNLTEFGAAGAVLDRHRLARDPRPAIRDPLENSEITPVEGLGEPRFPVWPEAAYRIGWGGTIQVDMVVHADGRLSHPRLLSAPPVATLALAAFDAMRANRYAPARVGGEPIDSVYRFTMKFTYTR